MSDDLLRIGYGPSYIPQSFDYTSRDYYAIREHLIEVVKSRIPEWSGEDPADFGLALVEAFAYLGDLMSYYIDRAGNEAFLPTATRRQSVLNIARTLGYVPTRAIPATGEATFTTEVTYTGTDISVPKGTVINASIKRENGYVDTVQFTTDDAITVADEGASTTVAITEGYIADSVSTSNHGVVVGISDGSPDQEFELPLSPVAHGSLEVYVSDGVTWTLWNEVGHIIEYTALDNVYETRLMADGSVVLVFGDGVTGRIPPTTQTISAKFRVGGGLRGNLPAGTIVNIEDSGLDVNLSVTNQASTTGGTDEESTFSIRENAATGFRANRRAVNKDDIETLARGVEGCYAASANATVWSNVTLAIAPNYDGSLSPGLDGTVGTDVITGNPTTTFTTTKAAVKAAVEPLMMMGSSLTVRDPEYAKVQIGITVQLVDTASQAFATADIKRILLDGPLSFERRGFGGSLTAADIYHAIFSNTGYITGGTVDDLFRKDTVYTSGVYPTEAAWYEILVLDTDNDLTIDFGGTGISDL
jgi:hypothetical protein